MGLLTLRFTAAVGIALGAVLLVSCFDPNELDGTLHCGVDRTCPGGFECRDDQLCWRRPELLQVDAAPGAMSDAPSSTADSATPTACKNGLDDDCDGKIDNEDPGCANGEDTSEKGTKECDDGVDNDGDELIDFRVPGCGPPGDPNCDKPDRDDEQNGSSGPG